MTEKEIKRLIHLSLPEPPEEPQSLEQIRQPLHINLTNEFCDLFDKAIEELKKNVETVEESEDKTMTHEVEITTIENRVIEEYWVMRAVKENAIVKGTAKQVFKEQELTHNQTLQEIAQFLSESKADFVSVEHNYRFSDLPFC